LGDMTQKNKSGLRIVARNPVKGER
jgi:hypothetical protein